MTGLLKESRRTDLRIKYNNSEEKPSQEMEIWNLIFQDMIPKLTLEYIKSIQKSTHYLQALIHQLPLNLKFAFYLTSDQVAIDGK